MSINCKTFVVYTGLRSYLSFSFDVILLLNFGNTCIEFHVQLLLTISQRRTNERTNLIDFENVHKIFNKQLTLESAKGALTMQLVKSFNRKRIEIKKSATKTIQPTHFASNDFIPHFISNNTLHIEPFRSERFLIYFLAGLIR